LTKEPAVAPFFFLPRPVVDAAAKGEGDVQEVRVRAGFPLERDPARHPTGGAERWSAPFPPYLPPYLIGQRARIFYPCSTGFESRRGLVNLIRLAASAVNELSPYSAFNRGDLHRSDAENLGARKAIFGFLMRFTVRFRR
jgi:hypothetical protein